MVPKRKFATLLPSLAECHACIDFDVLLGVYTATT